jgi:hypothetical protein
MLRSRFVVGLAVVIVLLALYRVRTPVSAPSPEAAPQPAEALAEAETRRALMQAAYADLEKDRLLLNQQLGALNARIWGMRLPAARARSVQNDMMAAKQRLTNPPLLGAFVDPAGIQHERDRVNAAKDRLRAINEQLDTAPGNPP